MTGRFFEVFTIYNKYVIIISLRLFMSCEHLQGASMQEAQDTLRQRKKEEYQRRIIREIRTVIPDLASIPMITEVVCGARVDARYGTAGTATMAELQEMWHNAPEGTDAARHAFKLWNARAQQELDCILVDIDKATGGSAWVGGHEQACAQLKQLFYNSPPGGSVRRIIIARLLKGLVYQ